ncbi:type I secretion system permease/ATPase [Candidatus Halocynthiibacter alkanivorans]|uniref:type I secretion system permease/ATPase n=1 Tax=Candidatus Halocynthiibacter alkanivorans TaxID=2267619 RepID=UPI000DF30DE0|nr:type I secretion system permease/ATPase [Candidatus Halocynthiibacter alkanivorans]
MGSDLGKAFRRHIPTLTAITVFSIFINLLMLTGPLFMLQVYDRVLSSRSEATLLALFALVAGLFAAMGVLDYVRGRVGARIGAGLQSDLDARVFQAGVRAPAKLAPQAATALSDLDAIQRFFSAPVSFAIFDIPWTPIFFAAIFLFHPLLGWLAVAGGLVLVLITLCNQILTRKSAGKMHRDANTSTRLAEQIRTQPETVIGLGMIGAAIRRWQGARGSALSSSLTFHDRSGGFTSFSKMLRMLVQSAILALGAWLVLQNELSAGAMIAGSVLLGRALAPVEQLIQGWGMVLRARQGWNSLGTLLTAVPESEPVTPLPDPQAKLVVKGVTVMMPGTSKPMLNQVSFAIGPGQALGVIGISASGKSTLARVLTGYLKPNMGEVRLDGATLAQYGPDGLAQHIGYLPQDVVLFDGTVAENIMRLQPESDPALAVRAAQAAAAHDVILQLKDGYDTRLGFGGVTLSGGQRQRVGLARALFGDPAIVILDEASSNLDAEGTQALNQTVAALKAAGKAVITIAHRPTAIAECDLVLVLANGAVQAFGPRDEVLRKALKNHSEIVALQKESQHAT